MHVRGRSRVYHRCGRTVFWLTSSSSGSLKTVPVSGFRDFSIAYIYILFYSIIQEADMRLSFAGVPMLPYNQQDPDTCIRRNHTSRHRDDGYAVGDPRLVNLSPMGGIPRRSCDSSQQADRVGLIWPHGSTFVVTSPFRMLPLSNKRMRQCQDLLSRDRNTGAHWYSDAIPIASPISDEYFSIVIRTDHPILGFTRADALLICCPFPRVGFWNNQLFQKSRINLTYVSQSE